MGIGQMDLVLSSNCTFHMFCESQKCLTPVIVQVLRLSYLLSLWRISVREWIRDSLPQKEELLSGFRAPYHQLLFFCFWRRWCSPHQWTCYHYDGGNLHLDHLVIRLKYHERGVGKYVRYWYVLNPKNVMFLSDAKYWAKDGKEAVLQRCSRSGQPTYSW